MDAKSLSEYVKQMRKEHNLTQIELSEKYNHKVFAGILTEDENGYTFQYDADYLHSDEAEAISLTMPLDKKLYNEKILFPFFDGLIPEGWLLDVAEKSWF